MSAIACPGRIVPVTAFGARSGWPLRGRKTRMKRPRNGMPSPSAGPANLLIMASLLVLHAVGAEASTGDPMFDVAPCRLIGGGCLNSTAADGSRRQSTFGGGLGRGAGSFDPAGSAWEHVYRANRTMLARIRSLDARIVRCLPDASSHCSEPPGNSRAEFEGTGRITLLGEDETAGNFQAIVTDVRCGTERDFYSITIRRGSLIGQGEIVLEESGELGCGNLNIAAPWENAR